MHSRNSPTDETSFNPRRRPKYLHRLWRGYVLVNQQRFESSVIVMPEQLISDWSPRELEQLTQAHFAEIAALATGRSCCSAPARCCAFRIRA